jgi:hypothetical protein
LPANASAPTKLPEPTVLAAAPRSTAGVSIKDRITS